MVMNGETNVEILTKLCKISQYLLTYHLKMSEKIIRMRENQLKFY